MLETIIAAQAASALAECCGLLAASVQGPFASEPGRLTAAATCLIDALPGDQGSAPVNDWQRNRSPGAGAVADLVILAERINSELAARMAGHLLAWPQTYAFDRALVPAMTRLLQGGAARSGPAMSRLLPACLAHLKARAALPLEAPRDWSRPAEIRCTCQHCRAVNRFLADRDTPEWTLRAAEGDRSHVQASINEARADVDFTTERRGRPYGLVCKKNSASYQRRVEQRRQDLADIAVLKGS